ncbi:cation acetate symporter [Prauserella muralis]|uniref:Cation acetate symporter n=1 Tax=Prauserella muralis TaxID=588067 RepID=A0A2V4BMC1_9PSEU|nr:cation acetate symporter [Prauserella muralis]PXY31793.1 cation acetate symporter [Prauserella muralis]TWE13810.1 sodium:solute symporter family protein [Prauserella muralis]
MQLNVWALTGIALVMVVTYYLGQRSSRFASSTHDFLVARRTVRSRRNAAAISGEYISAASFLGIAGLVLKEGADALWFPIGFTAGYLALMLFVAAPLRRSGAYTLPDFMEARLGSTSLRTLSTWFVVFIGVLYMLPQLQGAGIALATILPAPAWVGVVAVTVVIAFNVMAGGMRAITLVQAFQYWLKLFALAVPTFVLCVVFFGSNGAGSAGGLSQEAPPRFTDDTTLTVETDVLLRVDEPTSVRVPADSPNVTVWSPGTEYPVAEGTTLWFPARSDVPVVSDGALQNADWLRPAKTAEDMLGTYSLILATFLGTMGLPHVLVRFYTNPDGKAARRTTVQVLLLLGLFYLFPVMIGALSRMYVPQLLVTGNTDAAVLLVPSQMLPGVAGQILVAITAAGAFAAFLSTSSGLLVSVAGVIATDLLAGKVRDFRLAAVLTALVPAGLALSLPVEDLSLSVGMSFALAASTFCPLLVLGIWWRRLTWTGAMLGMCVGGGLVLLAVALNAISERTGSWAPWFLQQPALFTVPAAFLVTVVVSLGTARRVPDDVNAVMLRLHAPDPLGFMRDRAVARFGRLDERPRSSRGGGRHRK